MARTPAAARTRRSRDADEIIPGWQRLAEISAIGVRERAELEIPIVGVVPIDQTSRPVISFEDSIISVLEAVAQPERAVVMEVVTDPRVGRRSCGRSLKAGCGSTVPITASIQDRRRRLRPRARCSLACSLLATDGIVSVRDSHQIAGSFLRSRGRRIIRTRLPICSDRECPERRRCSRQREDRRAPSPRRPACSVRRRRASAERRSAVARLTLAGV